MEWSLPVVGMAIGFAVAAPLGPVNLLVIRYTLNHGLAGGLTAGAGAVIGDALFAAMAAFGISAVIDLMSAHATAIEVVGGVVLVAMGLRTAIAHVDAASIGAVDPRRTPGSFRLFLATFVLTITNPATLLAFLAIFGTVGVRAIDVTTLSAGLLVLSVMVGSSLWWLILSTVVARLRGRLSVTVLDRLNRYAGVAIASFGAAILFRAASVLAGLR